MYIYGSSVWIKVTANVAHTDFSTSLTKYFCKFSLLDNKTKHVMKFKVRMCEITRKIIPRCIYTAKNVSIITTTQNKTKKPKINKTPKENKNK